MRLVLLSLTLLSYSCFGQTSGTIQIEKEKSDTHPVARFQGLENGPIIIDSLKNLCLESNLGEIQSFEMIAENSKGMFWVKSATGCFSKNDFQQLQELKNGSQIEFINLLGIDDLGNQIIFPGMKFVIRKK